MDASVAKECPGKQHGKNPHKKTNGNRPCKKLHGKCFQERAHGKSSAGDHADETLRRMLRKEAPAKNSPDKTSAGVLMEVSATKESTI